MGVPPFSKRFVIASLVLLVSVFFPWFQVNVVLTTFTVFGYNLGFLTVLFIILGVAGVVGSSVQLPRFRALIETVVGVVAAVLLSVAYNRFYATLADRIHGFIGNFANSQELSGMIGGVSFGFYVALLASIVLIFLGIQALGAHRTEPLLPEDWKVIFDTHQLKQVKDAALETTATIAEDTMDKLRAVRLKSQNRYVWTTAVVLGIAVVYGLFVAVWNSNHTPQSTVERFTEAVKSGDVNRVTAMISTDKPVEPFAVQGFVDYYKNNVSSLQNLVSDHLVKQNSIGFVTYRISLPTTAIQLSAPNGAKFSIGGQSVSSNPTLLPGVYQVSATIDTPLGPATETQKVDTTTQKTVNFTFKNNTLRVASRDLGDAKGTLVVNGKSMPISFQDVFFYGTGEVGPVPSMEGQKIRVEFLAPWGKYVESGTVKGWGCEISAGPDDNPDVLKAVSRLIFEFGKEDTANASTGNYDSEQKFLVPDSPIAHLIQNKNGKTDSFRFIDVVVSPNISLTKANGNFGVKVKATETYSNSAVTWIYQVIYNSTTHEWKIYDQEWNSTPVNKNEPGAIVLTNTQQ